MPRNGTGTYTLPTGNPVVTGTTIESNWANTTLSDVATELTGSLARSGAGGMTGALRLADGSQSVPGLAFSNETGTGLYRAGTGEMWVTVQGAQTMNVDATGVTVPSDKATSIEGTFVFNETGADKDARFEGDTDVNLLFTDASTDRVGVGTNTPANKLTVNGNADITGDLGVGTTAPAFGSGSGVEIQRAGVATLRLENSTASNSFEMYADSAANGINLRGRDSSPMNFWTANTSQMTLDASGNLGIGTGAPAAKLEVVGSVGNVQVDSSGARVTFTRDDANYIRYGSTNGVLVFEEGTAERMRIDTSGNVGIGTNAPASALDVVGDARSNAWIGRANGSAPTADCAVYRPANNTLGFSTANTERARIDSSGNVNIGTTGVAVKLYVSGNAAQNIATLTDAATITPDFSTANNFSVTLGGNRTLANPTNLTAGQSGVIFISQDSGGNRTLAFSSYWDFPNASAPSLTTTANAVDVLVYTVRSTTSIAAQLITNIG